MSRKHSYGISLGLKPALGLKLDLGLKLSTLSIMLLALPTLLWGLDAAAAAAAPCSMLLSMPLKLGPKLLRTAWRSEGHAAAAGLAVHVLAAALAAALAALLIFVLTAAAAPAAAGVLEALPIVPLRPLLLLLLLLLLC
jgi:hypothetical protein